MRLIFLILLLIPAVLSAQDFPYDSECSEKVVRSIEDISASIISDSFSPMTHYSAGNTTLSAVPSYFTADRLMEDPDVDGKDFRGGALGGGFGYAVTDDFMAYFIAAGMKMNGDLEYKAFGKEFGTVKSSGSYSLVSLLGGCGFDFLDNGTFSIPVYLGAQVQYFSADWESDQLSWTDQLSNEYSAEVEMTGSGFLYGISGGIALSAKIFDKVKITPYFLYIHNFNEGEMKADASLTSENPLLSGAEKYKFDVEPVSAFMTGLNIGYIGDSGFSASVALGSMISSLTGYGSQASANGVEMKSFVLILSYNM